MWEDQEDEEVDNEDGELEGQLLSDLISSNKYGKSNLTEYFLNLYFYIMCYF